MTKPQNEKVPRDIEWTAVNITDHVQRFKLDGDELFVEKKAYQTLSRKLDEANELFTQAHALLKSRDEQINEMREALEKVTRVNGSMGLGDAIFIAMDALEEWSGK